MNFIIVCEEILKNQSILVSESYDFYACHINEMLKIRAIDKNDPLPVIMESASNEIFRFDRNGLLNGSENVLRTKYGLSLSKLRVSHNRDLPEGTLVMCGRVPNASRFRLRFYGRDHKAYIGGSIPDSANRLVRFQFIIPYDKFKPHDLETSIIAFNYGTW